MSQINKEWIEELSSAAPTPGGGGAAALSGGIGAALGMMVANLTVGKKKYADVQDDMKDCLARLEILRDEMLALIEADARGFEPLANAYSMPASTKKEKAKKKKIMEDALKMACLVPLKTMEKGLEILKITEELAEKGSTMAISDVAVAAQILRAAVFGASMNVFINTKTMKNRELAEKFNNAAENSNKAAAEMADRIFFKIEGELKCR
ncbi:methenyltetrahydrofolate cyclohydrolase [Clostridiales bacterium]|nr:methenyltetrahydrofolate cyclohydrolase [Clostridiales bacterium]